MFHLGRSISSVLTDNDGNFIIGNDDLKFEGNESRPDLILIVFTPELPIETGSKSESDCFGKIQESSF